MKNPGLGKSFMVSALMLLAFDVYVAFVSLQAAPVWVKALVFVPTAVYLLAIFRVFVLGKQQQTDLNATLRLTIMFFFPALIFVLVSAIGLLAGLIWAPLKAVFEIAGSALAVAWMLMALYGIAWGWKRIQVEKIDLSFPDLPEIFDGYRIVHLSDFHIGTYSTSPSTVKSIVDKVNGLDADLIVFTGDLINRQPAETLQFVDELKRLKAHDGVLSVLGNHDYCLYNKYTYPDNARAELRRLIEIEKDCGWSLLRNSSIRINRRNAHIDVVGVENAGTKGFPDYSDLDLALSDTAAGSFKILLTHDPTHWRRKVVGSTDIRLTLSGHTHGMQFKLGRFTPSRLSYREWGGVYRLGWHTLVVSTGIGSNIAFRYGIYPKILLLTLKKSQSSPDKL